MSQQINLFNPLFLKQKTPFGSRQVGYALGLILVLGVLLFAYSAYQSWALSRQADRVGTQLQATQQQLDKVNAQAAPRKKNQALEDEVNRVQSEHASLQRAMTRLQSGEFGNRKGYSSYMRAFARQSVAGLWLTGFSIDGAGNAIGIQGRALQPELVPAYMQRLGQEPVMQGKSFAILDMHLPGKEQPGTVPGMGSVPAAVTVPAAAVPAAAGTQAATAIGTGTAAVTGAMAEADKKKASPNYIEFDLRSEGVVGPSDKPGTVVKPQADSSGVR